VQRAYKRLAETSGRCTTCSSTTYRLPCRAILPLAFSCFFCPTPHKTTPYREAAAAASSEEAVITMAANNNDASSRTAKEEDFYIQCDAPNCNEWYEGSTLFPPITPILASTYETWHCPSCIPYHGPSTLKSSLTAIGRREGLRKKRRIDFVKLNDPAALLESESGNNIGVAANDVQEVDFRAKLQLRQKKGMFQKGHYSFKVTTNTNGGGRMEEFNRNYVDRHGFNQPVLFATHLPFQIGLNVPGKNTTIGGAPFSFDTVAKLVGPYRTTQVIDTATQLTTEYTLQEWVDYLDTPESERTRILNVITLEYSQTPLGKLVTEPQFARDVDFVSQCWPKTIHDLQRILDHRNGGGNNQNSSDTNNDNIGGGGGTTPSSSSSSIEEEDLAEQLNELQDEIPRVSKYCLMSAAGSYTDFHVDFGGTAVWYHVYFGQKIFYFIVPTSQNLKIYSEWATNGKSSSSKKSSSTKTTNAFLPDLITAAGGKVFEVHLKKGQTLFIPSGWIHAVFTPKDSLVFGGNFVHAHSLEMQLTIYRLEKKMRVGSEYKFPNYQKLMWYVAWDFLKQRDDLMMQITSSGSGSNDENVPGREEQVIQQLCDKYPNHVLLGYRALAKELETWSRSKQKSTTDQFPTYMDVTKVAIQLGELLAKCVTHLGVVNNKKKEKPKNNPEKEKKKKKNKTKQDNKKRENSQISQKKKPVITPIKTTSSSSPPANKKCIVGGCSQYKRSKCDGYCATHYREQLSLQNSGGDDTIDYQAIPPPGRGCKVEGCNKYKKSRCEGYCLMCFRASSAVNNKNKKSSSPPSPKKSSPPSPKKSKSTAVWV
jgi:hypothetical protein